MADPFALTKTSGLGVDMLTGHRAMTITTKPKKKKDEGEEDGKPAVVPPKTIVTIKRELVEYVSTTLEEAGEKDRSVCAYERYLTTNHAKRSSRASCRRHHRRQRQSLLSAGPNSSSSLGSRGYRRTGRRTPPLPRATWSSAMPS